MSSPAASSSQSASPEPQLPRCGMSSLPTEVKARIVELCAEQDERFKVELAKAGRPMPKYDSRGRSAQQGRSLRALFEVSKQFSELAAPFPFQALKASKLDITFKCLVRRRLDLFKELHLDTHDLNKLIDVVSVLPNLIDLRSLHMGFYAIRKLWLSSKVTMEPLIASGSTAQYAAAAFSSLTSVTELHCESIMVSSIESFLSAYQTLTVLNVRFNRTLVADDDDVLLDALALAPNLRRLVVLVEGDYAPWPLFDIWPVNATRRAPVRELSITIPLLHHNLFDFAASFSATLEQLSFSTTYPPPSSMPPSPIFTNQVFLHVKRFFLSGYEMVVNGALASLTPKVFPSLTQIDLDLFCVDTWEGPASPLMRFSSFPLLSTVRIPKLRNNSPDSVSFIERFCAENGLTLETDSPSLASSFCPPASGNSIPRRAEDIRTTLAHLEDKVDKAEKDGDVYRLDQIMTTLATVEQERVTEKVWEAV
ncbi:hypothetical protein JCM6882_004171 [Rhodosporidiobolus microsporus]